MYDNDSWEYPNSDNDGGTKSYLLEPWERVRLWESEKGTTLKMIYYYSIYFMIFY